MRFIPDNAAFRGTLTSSATAAALPAAYLRRSSKGLVCRSIGTTLTLTLVWPTPEMVSGFVLPLTNMTAAGTIAVQGYTLPTDSSTVFNIPAALACPNIDTRPWDWSNLPPGANTFSYGGGNVARAWLAAPVAVRKLVVTLADPTNLAGYIEAAWLVVGEHFQPAKEADYGASATPLDFSTQTRSDAGEMIITLNPRSSKVTFTLSKLDPPDRARMWRMLRSNGKSRPGYLTLFPGHVDPYYEAAHQLWGVLVNTPMMATPSFNIAAASLDYEAI